MFRLASGDNQRHRAAAVLAPIAVAACLALPGLASAGVSVHPDTGRLSIGGLGGGGPLREAINAGSGPGGRVGFLAGAVFSVRR